MKKKNVTIDDLAIMVNKGFDSVTKEMRSGFQQSDKRFNEINRRFDKIESLMLVEHRTRIERLEKKVERLEGLLAVR